MAERIPESGQVTPQEHGRIDVKAEQPSGFHEGRRAFLRDALVAGGTLASMGGVASVAQAAAQEKGAPSPKYHYVPVSADTVHWGYFSKLLKPVVEVDSGDYVTIETLTHHAADDWSRMIQGDPGAESVYHWTKNQKNVNRRGAGPMKPTIYGRGAGEGMGVHICTGPVFVRGAEPGDILEVRILDTKPRPCANPDYAGKQFGSNAAAWWGFHYKDLLTEPKPREVITIYEIDAKGEKNWATAVYNFRWVPQTDPFGVVHKIIDYPGVPVNHKYVEENHGILKNVRIHLRPHFGTLGLAPCEADMVDSIPPSYTGGNIDNWRIGKGATVYYPVAVPGGLFRRATRTPRRGTRNSAARRSSARSPARSSSSSARRTRWPGPLWRICSFRFWKRRTNGACTASATRITSRSWEPRPKATFTANRRSIWPCGTPSAKCGTS